MITIVHGLNSGLAAVRLNCALLPRLAFDQNPRVGATTGCHMRSDWIASTVKSKERT